MPFEKEIYRYAQHITEIQGDIAKTLLFIRLDCAACCNGCFCVLKKCAQSSGAGFAGANK